MIAKVQQVKMETISIDYEHFYFNDNDDSMEDYVHDYTEFVQRFSERNAEVYPTKFDVETSEETGYFILLTNTRVTLEQKLQIANDIVEMYNNETTLQMKLVSKSFSNF